MRVPCNLFFIIILLISCNQNNETKFAELKGSYLGQKPPGMIPEIFAPGIISTDKKELNSVFTVDGDEFFFSIQTPGEGYSIWSSKNSNDLWQPPQIVTFSSSQSDVDMCISHDGKRLFFSSARDINGIEQDNYKIWYVDKIINRWSNAKYLDSPINDAELAMYPTVSNNGTMFFQSIRKDSYGGRDIYYSKLINGDYAEPIHLDKQINSEFSEGDVLIAPDESFIIVNSVGRPDAIGGGDLYISFKQINGTWSKLKNMGSTINTTGHDYCPMLSPDGKYFFYTSTIAGSEDIYWVDSKIIMSLKPDDLAKE